MLKRLGIFPGLTLGIALLFVAGPAKAQLGNAGSIEGVVKDPSGSAVPGAKVEITYVISGLDRVTTTDADGGFKFTNVPFNTYHAVVTATGFAPYRQDVDVRSAVPVKAEFTLKISTEVTQVTVTEKGADLIETESTFHTDVDKDLFEKLPLEGTSSPFTSLVTLTSPGVAADSNGLMHGLGDHAENSVSLDGQPQTDQFSKVFSNQIPPDSIQSMEVISGAPPAEYGDKTSLVVKVTTRSGLGARKPTGSVTSSYGSFGSSNAGVDLAYGGNTWGNFIALSGLQTGRFLDAPEFGVMHDKGNTENAFDRVDFQVAKPDTLHLNFGYTRSWFENPNSFDQQFRFCNVGLPCDTTGTFILNNVTGNPLGTTDQRSQIKTLNVAPTWTHLIGTKAVVTFGGYVRKDDYNYYGSPNPLNDLAPDLQAESANQNRTLTNAGLRSDISYAKGIHNLKLGAVFQHTFLTENDHLGIVDPTFNAVCLNADGTANSNPTVTNQAQCGGPLNPGGSPNLASATGPGFQPFLGCFDLTRPKPDPADSCASTTSIPFLFHGHGDVKEVAMYVEDTITKGSWSFNLGIRGDLYRGFTYATQAEPRLGVAYNIKPMSTVLRVSYARLLETPFNENLVIASEGCNNPVVVAIVSPFGTTCNLGALSAGYRNEFHAGLEQALGKYLVVNAEYIWKYTHNAFDFGVVGATPITFPIEWHNSKIPGYALRVNVPNFHGFSALTVMSGVSARYFNPQVAGIAFFPSFNVFRIDHDERFNQNTHLQYQPWRRGPWFGFNWRYNSGLVSGAVPCLAATPTCSAATSAVDGGLPTNTFIPQGSVAMVNAITGLPLTADQEYQAGLACNGVAATPSTALPFVCPATQLTSNLVKIPAPGRENDDHNPQRMQPRNLFDLAAGDDDLFHGDRFKWSLRLTVINVYNKKVLYNFLSTFSGTHYVTPRAFTVELGFHF